MKTSKLFTKTGSTKEEKKTASTESHWKYSFYVNKNDKRVIVPKQNPMMGWTLNFGNPTTYIIIVAFIIIIYLTKQIVRH